jgi:hypothetical protein
VLVENPEVSFKKKIKNDALWINTHWWHSIHSFSLFFCVG